MTDVTMFCGGFGPEKLLSVQSLMKYRENSDGHAERSVDNGGLACDGSEGNLRVP